MINIKDIVDLTPSETVPVGKAYGIISAFDYPLRYPIYIEFFEEDYFRSYFTKSNVTLTNPITGISFKPRGPHNFHKKIHYIAIIFNDIWEKTLLHELMHCYQHERMGKRLWHKMKICYRDHYYLDPLEVQAEWYAIQKIKEIN